MACVYRARDRRNRRPEVGVEAVPKCCKFIPMKPAYIPTVNRPISNGISQCRSGAKSSGPSVRIGLVIIQQNAIRVESDDWFHSAHHRQFRRNDTNNRRLSPIFLLVSTPAARIASEQGCQTAVRLIDNLRLPPCPGAETLALRPRPVAQRPLRQMRACEQLHVGRDDSFPRTESGTGSPSACLPLFNWRPTPPYCDRRERRSMGRRHELPPLKHDGRPPNSQTPTHSIHFHARTPREQSLASARVRWHDCARCWFWCYKMVIHGSKTRGQIFVF